MNLLTITESSHHITLYYAFVPDLSPLKSDEDTRQCHRHTGVLFRCAGTVSKIVSSKPRGFHVSTNKKLLIRYTFSMTGTRVLGIIKYFYDE